MFLIIYVVYSAYVFINKPPSVAFFKNNPEQFSFEYFYTRKQFLQTLNEILHEGMSKKEVERLFLEKAGAKESIKTSYGDSYSIYRKENFSARWVCGIIRVERADLTTPDYVPKWEVIVKYDEDKKLKKFKLRKNFKKEYLVYGYPACRAYMPYY